MPVRKVKGGWRWGGKGHGHRVYKTRVGAERQGAAIRATGWREK